MLPTGSIAGRLGSIVTSRMIRAPDAAPSVRPFGVPGQIDATRRPPLESGRRSCFLNRLTLMPLYEYECKKCGHRFEKIQKFSDRMVKKCPECGGQVEQMISAPPVQFKGSGWNVTDYAKKSSSQGSSGNSDSSARDSSSDSASRDSSSKEKKEEKSKSDSGSKDSSSKESSSKESSSKESSAKETPRKGSGRRK